MMYIQKVHAQPTLYRPYNYDIPQTHPHQPVDPIPQTTHGYPNGTRKNNLEGAPFTFFRYSSNSISLFNSLSTRIFDLCFTAVSNCPHSLMLSQTAHIL